MNKKFDVSSKLAHMPEYELQRVAIQTKDLDELEYLSHSDYHEVQLLVSENNYCSAELLREFSKDTDPMMLANVAFHTNTEPDVLDKLSKHPDFLVRLHVSGNQNTPIETLNYLVNDCEVAVREVAIARLISTDSLVEDSNESKHSYRMG